MSLPYQKGDLYSGFVDKLKKKGLARTNDFYVKFNINENIAKLPFIVPERFSLSEKREISFMCKNVALPKLSFTTQDFVAKPGVTTKTAMKREETGMFSLTFLTTPDLWEKKFFERWMNFVVDPKTYTPNYYDEYAKYNDITVFVLPRTFSGQMVMEDFIDFVSVTDLNTVFNGGSPIQTQNNSNNNSFFGGGPNSFSNFSVSDGRGIGSREPIYYVKFFECYPTGIGEVAMSTSNDSAPMEFTVEMTYKYFQTITDIKFSSLKQDVY